MVEVGKMSTFTSTVDDLNLDFSDRNWEISNQNGQRLQFEFKLHDTDSELSGSEVESEVEECDMDDEYFFDHRLDFGSYVPKVNESGTDANERSDGGGSERGLVNNEHGTHNGKCDNGDSERTNDVITNISNMNVDENKNEEKVITNTDVGKMNGMNLDSLTTAVEKFSVAVSLVCIIFAAFCEKQRKKSCFAY